MNKIAQDMVERVVWAMGRESLAVHTLSPEVCISVARAAIESMREPTPKMLEYAGVMNGYDDYETENVDQNHIDWWRLMIDAALSKYRGEPTDR